MKFSSNQQRGVLWSTLALTLIVALSAESKDREESSIVQPSPIKEHPQYKTDAENDLPIEVGLATINRQPLPESKQDMFAVKSWVVQPPQVKKEQPIIPPLPFVYQGKLVEDEGRIVVLLSAHDKSYAVRVGDVLDRVYRVDEVKPPVLALTYLPLDIKQTMQIGASN